MDKKIKRIHIIGFPKCGSSSLRKYLQLKTPHLARTPDQIRSFPAQSLYHPDWETVCGGICSKPDTLSVIITRNPVERLYSAYYWSQKWNEADTIHPTLEEFLHWQPKGTKRTEYTIYLTSGLVDPIECCDYEKYIKKAYKYNPLILRFEDMIKNPTFPNEAKTNVVLHKALIDKINIKPKPDQMSDNERKLIVEELYKAGIPIDN